MSHKAKKVGRANSIVIIITFILFAGALLTKGFTHDLLLEAGVFLVSVKLILATYQIKLLSEKIDDRLDKIEKAIKKE